ncbi:MAG: hypothetical protein U9N34_02820, partial [Candidatus Cloacimonadota bacterium]|nr:hypothetical protein [Candidatus Cloacimonadota bacterium]
LFEETYSFLEHLEFTYLHLFTYSKRFGTPAAKFKNQVNGNIIKDRINRLQKLAELKKKNFINKVISEKIILNGIIENKEDNFVTALSDRYLRIYSKREYLKKGELHHFIPLEIFKDGILAD